MSRSTSVRLILSPGPIDDSDRATPQCSGTRCRPCQGAPRRGSVSARPRHAASQASRGQVRGPQARRPAGVGVQLKRWGTLGVAAGPACGSRSSRLVARSCGEVPGAASISVAPDVCSVHPLVHAIFSDSIPLCEPLDAIAQNMPSMYISTNEFNYEKFMNKLILSKMDNRKSLLRNVGVILVM